LIGFGDASLQDDEKLGRLKTTTKNSDVDGDKSVYSYGGRAFFIFDEGLNMIYDTGSDLKDSTAAEIPHDFNCNNDENDSFDAHSDDKGLEPEGVTVTVINDIT